MASYREAEWRAGLAGELEFWRRWARVHRDLALERIDPRRPLMGCVDRAVTLVEAEPVRILEVGAGMVSVMGRVHSAGKRLEFTHCDPLGHAFPAILAEHAIPRPYPVLPSAAEELRQHFAAESFDVVFGQNCLDHCWDPRAVFGQIAEVLRPGGRLVIRHIYRCRARNNVEGLHRWDFFVGSGQVVVEGEGPRWIVGSGLPLKLEHVALELAPPVKSEAWLVATFVKV